MRFSERKIKGVYEIDPSVFSDERGVFTKSYDKEAFRQFSLDKDWVQENHSATFSKGTIRGFHLQIPPFAEAKLVRCIKGEVLNVFVDLRKESATFGEWDSIELTSDNRKMIYIPEMFANAFCILKNNTELIYKSNNVFRPEFEKRICWDDPDLNIKWPFPKPTLSDKDRNNNTLAKFIEENL